MEPLHEAAVRHEPNIRHIGYWQLSDWAESRPSTVEGTVILLWLPKIGYVIAIYDWETHIWFDQFGVPTEIENCHWCYLTT